MSYLNFFRNMNNFSNIYIMFTLKGIISIFSTNNFNTMDVLNFHLLVIVTFKFQLSLISINYFTIFFKDSLEVSLPRFRSSLTAKLTLIALFFNPYLLKFPLKINFYFNTSAKLFLIDFISYIFSI